MWHRFYENESYMILLCLRKTISGAYPKQHKSDLFFQTRNIFFTRVSSSLVRWPNVILQITNYLFLNTNFALKLQGKSWKNDVVMFTAHLNVTIKSLTRFKQEVVLAAMLEGKSMPFNMAANTTDTTFLKNQSAMKYLS